MTEADAYRLALHVRLDTARAALLRALEGLTERDFAAPLPPGDESIVRVLAVLAAEERALIAGARGEQAATRIPAKPLPPQAVHDLAGARYQARALIDDPAIDTEAARDAVERIAALEEEVTVRIDARSRA